MKRTLLIDADVLAFQVTAANETPIDWGNDFWTLHSDLAECKDAFDLKIEEYLETLHGDDVCLCFSPKKNFRYRVYPQYKHHRVGKRKPVCYVPLKQYANEHYHCYQRPDLEGDDILGILATSPVIIKGEKVIVSIDKDLRTIPGLICNMREPYEIEEITVEEADYMHMLQTLTGDTADGYTGCPGIGKVIAERILKDVPRNYESMWKAVVTAYKSKGYTEEFALTQARVARICRREDYNFRKKEVILWSPPTCTTNTTKSV